MKKGKTIKQLSDGRTTKKENKTLIMLRNLTDTILVKEFPEIGSALCSVSIHTPPVLFIAPTFSRTVLRSWNIIDVCGLVGYLGDRTANSPINQFKFQKLVAANLASPGRRWFEDNWMIQIVNFEPVREDFDSDQEYERAVKKWIWIGAGLLELRGYD